MVLIIELFIKSSVVLAAALLGAGLLRRRSASLRHFLLSIALVGLAGLPALSILPSGWHASWLPDWAAVKSAGRSGAGSAAWSETTSVGRPEEPRLAGGAPGGLNVGAGGHLQGAPARRFRTALDAILPALWLSGMVLVLARLGAGLSVARRITREGEPLDDPAWRRLLQRFISAVRLGRKVEVKSHPRVPIPVTWGFRRPVVIMPSGTCAWSEDARSAALFHELSHVKRGDFLVMVLVRLSLAVFWFNPLFWAVYGKLKDEQEKACDELVLRAGIRPSTYADNLLAIMRSVRLSRSPAAPCPGILGMFGRSQIRERLLAILGRKIAFKEVGMKTKVIVSASVFLAVAFIGLARPRGAAAAREAGLLITEEAAPTTTMVVREQPAQDVQQKQEKQKKEETPPAAPKPEESWVKKEVKIIKRAREHGKEPVEITIIDGQTKKEIRLDGPVVVVRKDKDGRTVLVSPEGKELAIIGGEGTRLEIRGGRITMSDDEKDLDLDEEPMVFTWVEKDTKEDTVPEGEKKVHTVIVKTRPHREAVVEGEAPEHAVIKRVDEGDGEIVIKKRRVADESRLAAQAEEEKLQKRLAETQALLKKLDDQKLAESNLAAQQESLKALEHSLQALEEELKKKEESLRTLKVVGEPELRMIHDHGELPELEEEEIGADREKEALTWVGQEKGAFTIMLDLKLKNDPKATYDKTVARLERELPQGFKLEPKFLEESGTMVLKISSAGGSEEDRQKVQKLVEKLEVELKK